MSNYHKLRSSMAANIIGVIVLVLVVFGVIVSTVGFVRFFNTFQERYAVNTFHMADTASALVNGDHIDEYLAGEEQEEYARTKKNMDVFCQRMNVSLTYVIKVDTSDYGHFVSVFNSVNNDVDNSTYTEWELGYQRETTNDEYKEKYKAIYENGSRYESIYRSNPGGGAHPHITTLVPVEDDAGDVTALLCVQRPLSEFRGIIRPYLVTVILAAIVLSIIAGVFVSSFIRKHVVGPVRKVSNEAARFAQSKTKGAPLVNISRYTEIFNLANSIDTLETDMVTYMDELTEVTAEKERINSELEFASRIQASAVPASFPAFPDRSEFDIFASMKPAKEVGGDFYNFYFIDEDHLAITIGDVAGKGVPAALFMMVSNIMLAGRSRMGGSPAEILGYVNNRICEHNKSDLFVTIWLGILEVSTGKLTAANAGHEDIVICRKDGPFELFKTKHGFVAGAMTGIHYKDYEVRLEKGDKLFIYTDGIPEATDEEVKMFTVGRMVEALNEYRDKEPKDIVEGIYQDVRRYAGAAPQFDDMTMLCLEYFGKEE